MNHDSRDRRELWVRDAHIGTSWLPSLIAVAAMVFVLGVAQGLLAQERGGQQPQQRGQQAQRAGGHAPELGGGHIPQHGPAQTPRTAKPQPQQPRQGGQPQMQRDQPGHPEAPHVHAADDRWIGHDTGRNDPNYRLARPWEHGQFTGPIGPQHVWRLLGGGRDRFSIGGFYFAVAPFDLVRSSVWPGRDLL